jgi:hypothetical protein
MKNLTKNQKIALGIVALVGAYFAYKQFTKPKIVIQGLAVEEVD